MASITDLLTAMQNGVTALNNLTLSGPKFSSFLIGNITGVNGLSTAATQVLMADATRTSIVFHNPSDVSLLIYQSSMSITFTSSTRGGGFLLLPQDYLMLSGNCAQAWTVSASSGTTHAITIATA